jgi:predicted DNA repair protein MutK
MPNLLWPRVRSTDIGASGVIGRTVHWLGVVFAAAILVIALGFAADGWSTSDAIWLSAIAVVMALGARGVRYLLAHE